jgi:hypothetical protein
MTSHAIVASAAGAPPPPRRPRKTRRRTGMNACVGQLLREIDVYLGFWAAARS